jgi:hypothetical protein
MAWEISMKLGTKKDHNEYMWILQGECCSLISEGIMGLEIKVFLMQNSLSLHFLLNAWGGGGISMKLC